MLFTNCSLQQLTHACSESVSMWTATTGIRNKNKIKPTKISSGSVRLLFGLIWVRLVLVLVRFVQFFLVYKFFLKSAKFSHENPILHIFIRKTKILSIHNLFSRKFAAVSQNSGANLHFPSKNCHSLAHLHFSTYDVTSVSYTHLTLPTNREV